jgi:hypothetical protein
MSAHLQTISRFFFGIVDQPQERDYRSVEQESKKSKLRLVFSQLIIQMTEKNSQKMKVKTREEKREKKKIKN